MSGTNSKLFTPEEATRMLPLVGAIARDATTAWKQLESAKRELRKTSARRPRLDPSGAPGPASADARRLTNDIKALERELEDRRHELEELGCTLRDAEKGLVDFPAFVGGELAYICWVPGEARVTHYHGMQEGFTGRKPLPAEARS